MADNNQDINQLLRYAARSFPKLQEQGNDPLPSQKV